MSGSRTTPPALKNQQTIKNKGDNSFTDEQIAHETYSSNTSTPVPSVINEDNEPILMEDTIRDSSELALTAKDDIETAKLIVAQQEKIEKMEKKEIIKSKTSSTPSSSSTEKPEDDGKEKSHDLKKNPKPSNNNPPRSVAEYNWNCDSLRLT